MENTIAALGIDIVLKVAGQGGDDLDPMLREKLREVGVFFRLDDGQVVAVDYMRADRAGGLDEVIEVFGNLRRAPGDVHRGGFVLQDPRADFPRRFPVHHLRAVRPGIDVAVGAGLVALAADVDLQRLEAPAPERGFVLGEG